VRGEGFQTVTRHARKANQVIGLIGTKNARVDSVSFVFPFFVRVGTGLDPSSPIPDRSVCTVMVKPSLLLFLPSTIQHPFSSHTHETRQKSQCLILIHCFSQQVLCISYPHSVYIWLRE